MPQEGDNNKVRRIAQAKWIMVSMYNTMKVYYPPPTDIPSTGEGAAQEHSSLTSYQVCARVCNM